MISMSNISAHLNIQLLNVRSEKNFVMNYEFSLENACTKNFYDGYDGNIWNRHNVYWLLCILVGVDMWQGDVTKISIGKLCVS